MKMFTVVLTYLIVYTPLLIIFALTPYITRKTESFGVSIPEEIYENAEVRNIRQKYRNNVLFWGIILTTGGFIIDLSSSYYPDFIFLPIGVFVQLAIVFAFYLKAHKKMKMLKQRNQWAVNKPQKVVIDTSFRSKKMMVSPWWFVSYLVVILATLGFGFLMYDKLPDRIPMNYNLSGEVTRWAEKSYRILLFAPLVQTFIMFLMMFVYWTIRKAKQQIDAAHPDKSIEQNRIFRYRWSLFTVAMGLVMLGLFGLMQLSIIGIIRNIWVIIVAPMVAVGIIIAAAIALSITTGQGGSRVRVKNEINANNSNRDDDQYWKLGVFYYNPDDPALFVEKRFGVGWTSNFARPMSWVMLIGLIVFIVLTTIGTKYLVK